MKTPIHFIIIDDDYVNNILCAIVIEPFASELEIKAFEDAEVALDYIIKEYSGNEKLTVLFLDINMPTWSGWDFLDHFECLDEKIKSQFRIYMLSSSVNLGDKVRAIDNINVVDYIEKPLNENCLLSILAAQTEIV